MSGAIVEEWRLAALLLDSKSSLHHKDFMVPDAAAVETLWIATWAGEPDHIPVMRWTKRTTEYFLHDALAVEPMQSLPSRRGPKPPAICKDGKAWLKSIKVMSLWVWGFLPG